LKRKLRKTLRRQSRSKLHRGGAMFLPFPKNAILEGKLTTDPEEPITLARKEVFEKILPDPGV